jgi:CBS domain-containing protein
VPDERDEKKGLPTKVHIAPSDIPVNDVARLMTARGVGAVVVMDDSKPVGIVTDRDIVVRVTALGLDSMKVLVGNVMSKPLVTVSVAASVDVAIELMCRHGIRRMPIVDEAGRLTSILTLDDILRLNLAGTADLSAIVRERPAPLAPLPEARAIASEAMYVPDPAPAMPPPVVQPSVSSRQVASVARSAVVVPMVKRRRRRTRVQAMRHWIETNRAFVLIMIGLSLAGSLVALSADFMGRAIYSYQQNYHYEPKDEARRLYLEEQQRARQSNKSKGSSR